VGRQGGSFERRPDFLRDQDGGISLNPKSRACLANSARVWDEEPAVFTFRVSYSEGRLAGSPSSVTGVPGFKRFFVIIGMYQLDVRVPRSCPPPVWKEWAEKGEKARACGRPE
jgi:hypothetical protein